MKKIIKIISIFTLFVSLSSGLFAVENKNNDNVELDEKTGFPLILKKPFPVFDYGLSSSWVTRIIKQTNRSNFVFQDTLVGAYVNMRSQNMEPLDSMIRLTLYYPIAYRFNNVPQPAVNMLNYAIDLFAAPVINLSFWNYISFDLGAGLHFLYEQGDRWHYFNLGLGAIARVDMPVARRWSLFVDGIASLDYGNLGNNSKMEPYDVVWQYQVSLGVRYSIKAPNKYSYIPSKKSYEDDIQSLKEKAEAKAAQKEAKKKAKEFYN